MRTIFIAVSLLLSAIISFAQEDYGDWVEKEQAKIDNFIRKNDQAFAEYLKQEWQAFEMYAGYQRDEKPKPDIVPLTAPMDIPQDNFLEPSMIIHEIQVPEASLIKESES